jgi:hypothetical protein
MHSVGFEKPSFYENRILPTYIKQHKLCCANLDSQFSRLIMSFINARWLLRRDRHAGSKKLLLLLHLHAEIFHQHEYTEQRKTKAYADQNALRAVAWGVLGVSKNSEESGNRDSRSARTPEQNLSIRRNISHDLEYRDTLHRRQSRTCLSLYGFNSSSLNASDTAAATDLRALKFRTICS